MIEATPGADGTTGQMVTTGRRRGRSWTANLTPALLLSPAALVMVALIGAPIAFMIFISFTDYNQTSLFTGAFSFVGLDQYTGAFTDPDFWASLLRTILFPAALVVGTVLLGMALAHWLTLVATWVRYCMSVVLLLAWAMPTVASTLMWTWLFEPGEGVVNWALTQLRIFGDQNGTNWGETPSLAFVLIWMLCVWGAVPFVALTLNAAERQAPAEYSEAAALDGANAWQTYRKVIVPFLAPTLYLVIVLSVIWDFNIFNQIWLISKGGPDNATSTLGVFTYTTAFVSFNLGRGSAIAIITTIILLLVAAVYIRNLLRSGEQNL